MDINTLYHEYINDCDSSSDEEEEDDDTVAIPSPQPPTITQGRTVVSKKRRASDPDDFKAVMENVTRDGHLLSRASKRLRSNRKIVMAAIEQTGMAIMYASNALRCDPDIQEFARGKIGNAWGYKEHCMWNREFGPEWSAAEIGNEVLASDDAYDNDAWVDLVHTPQADAIPFVFAKMYVEDFHNTLDKIISP